MLLPASPQDLASGRSGGTRLPRWTARELARKAVVGINTVQKIESGEVAASLAELVAIEATLAARYVCGVTVLLAEKIGERPAMERVLERLAIVLESMLDETSMADTAWTLIPQPHNFPMPS
jgi:transcriptional regulator with XRE-family HTH domain